MEIRIKIDEKGRKPIDYTFNIPDRWDDVPSAAYPHLASLYLAGESKMDKYDKTVRTFVLLARQHWAIIDQLHPEELFDLLPAVDWVFTRLDLRKNLQPVIKIAEVDYIGPADEMENIRFGEWCAADTFFTNYAQTEDIYQLHQLAAVLYRPAGDGQEYSEKHVTWRGDRREKFNDQLLAARTKLMATLPDHVIQGIYLFYASTRQMITSEYSKTFPAQKKKQLENPNGWLDIYDDLRSETKYSGPDRLDEEFLHSVLFSLERANIKFAKLKEDYDI